MSNEQHASRGESHDTRVKKVDRLSNTRVRITVEFPSSTLVSHEQSLTRRYANSVRIPGFRAGKAPLQMVHSKYRDEIRRDVVSHLLEHGLANALEQTKLHPISQPSLKVTSLPFEDTKSFEFEVEFDIQPEIELRNYKHIPLVSRSIDVAEEEVASALEELRERLATLEPLESETVSKGNFAVVEIGYKLVKDETKKEEPKNYTVEVGIGKLLPELDNALLEMKVGEKKTVKSRFPEDYGEKELDNQEALFECRLLELKKKILPELSDAFASQLKEGSTLEDVKAQLRETISGAKKEQNEKNRRADIIEYLIANNSFDAPRSLVENQSESLVSWMQEDQKRQGLPAAPLKPEERESIWRRAEYLVKSSLLLREIAIKEKIVLDEGLLNSRIEAIATKLNRSTDDARKWLSGKGMLERLRDEILTDQVFDFLNRHASHVEVPAASRPRS